MSGANGALTQLAAIGSHNAFLNVNPEVTYFKQQYRRHTNFAVAEADITFQSSVDFNRTLSATLPRNGDLLKEMYFQARISRPVIPAGTITNTVTGAFVDPAVGIIHWVQAVGHAMINYIEIEVGSQIIDRLYGDFLQMWERVAGKAGKYLGEMIGQFDTVEDLRDFAADDRILYVPVPFYFARHSECALPMIALQYHEVRVRVVLRSRTQLLIGFDPGFGGVADFSFGTTELGQVTGGALTDAFLTVNWVYLDVMERTINANQPHEYLITQVQFQSAEAVAAGTSSRSLAVHFNHPVLEFLWVYQEDQQVATPINRWFHYGVDHPTGKANYPWLTVSAPTPIVDPFTNVRLQLNGHDRIAQRDAAYFRLVQPYEHHSSIPTRFVYNYSFALDPEDHKPNGSINLSRIDNVIFLFNFNGPAGVTANAGEIRIYARSFNVVKIAGGMLALRHAN